LLVNRIPAIGNIRSQRESRLITKAQINEAIGG
jgi:hypothetical protein